jgi:hypothetical protein
MYSDTGCEFLPEDWPRLRFLQVKIRTRTANHFFNPTFGGITSPDIRLRDRPRPLTIPFLNNLSRNFGAKLMSWSSIS